MIRILIIISLGLSCLCQGQNNPLKADLRSLIKELAKQKPQWAITGSNSLFYLSSSELERLPDTILMTNSPQLDERCPNIAWSFRSKNRIEVSEVNYCDEPPYVKIPPLFEIRKVKVLETHGKVYLRIKKRKSPPTDLHVIRLSRSKYKTELVLVPEKN